MNICKRLWILSFAKNMGKNIGKNISKNLSGKYSQKHLDHVKQFAVTDALKTGSRRAIQKTIEETGNLICNKSAKKIMKVSKNPRQSNSETGTNENYKEIPKERYISPVERQKTIGSLVFNIIV